MKYTILVLVLSLVLILSSCGESQNLQQNEPLSPSNSQPHESANLPDDGLSKTLPLSNDISESSESSEFSFEGCTFYYKGQGYDVSSWAPSITSILSAIPVGEKIVVECHGGPENGIYRIFDTVSETFDEDIVGNHLIWNNDDITTSVYSFWSSVYKYDGSIIKTYDLTEDSFIYDLEYSNDYTKINVRIVHGDGTDETDTISL